VTQGAHTKRKLSCNPYQYQSVQVQKKRESKRKEKNEEGRPESEGRKEKPSRMGTLWSSSVASGSSFWETRAERRRRLQRLLRDPEATIRVRVGGAAMSVGSGPSRLAPVREKASARLVFVEDEWDDEGDGESPSSVRLAEEDAETDDEEDDGGNEENGVNWASNPPPQAAPSTMDPESAIPYEVLLRVARKSRGGDGILSKVRAVAEPYHSGLVRQLAQVSEDEVLHDDDDDKDGSSSASSSAASSEPDGTAITDKQVAGTPTGAGSWFDLDLAQVQYLANPSRRGNRIGILREHMVELHRVKLKDLPTTANYREEYDIRLRTLQHENLVPISGIAKLKENEYIVATGYLEHTLQEFINTGSKIPYEFVLRFAFQLCRAIYYLHQNGIAHLNVQSYCIFVDNSQPPNLALLDIGIGRAFRSSPFVNDCVIVAPEMLGKGGSNGKSVDIYHFGFVLWEMICNTNATPFMKSNDSLRRTVEEAIRPPLLAVPPEFRALISDCWAQDPSRRPSISAVLESIKTLIFATRQVQHPLNMQPETSSGTRVVDNRTSAVALRRNHRLLGKQTGRLLVGMFVLADLKSFSAILEGHSLQFRTNSSISLEGLDLFRVETFSFKRPNPDINLRNLMMQHFVNLQSKFIDRKGISIPQDVKTLDSQGASDGASPASIQKVALVLDYMNGIPLKDVALRGGCMDENFLARIAWGILQSLSFLHRFDQPHGAVCPSHVLIDRLGGLKLSGFQFSPDGTAQYEASWEYQSGDYGFIAPEIILGGKPLSEGDIWSLGMTLWACATGTYPMKDVKDFETAKEYASNYRMTPLVSQQSLVSQDFRGFVAICIRPEPFTRPSCEDLLLHPFLNMFVDYQTSNTSSLNDPDDMLISSQLGVENKLLQRLEKLVIRQEIEAMGPHLKATHSEEEFDRISAQISQSEPMFARHVINRALSASSSSKRDLTAAESCLALDSSRKALAEFLEEINMQWKKDGHPSSASMFVVDGEAPLESMFELAHAFGSEQRNVLCLIAYPSRSLNDLQTQIELRLTIICFANCFDEKENFARRGDGLMGCFSSPARGRKIKRNAIPKHDVFLGSPLHQPARRAKQLVVSWNAMKPSEIELAYAYQDDSEYLSQYIQRQVTLELESRILFYMFAGHSMAYGLLFRALAHALAGKSLVVVFEDSKELQTTRTILTERLESRLDETVFIFDAEALDEALEKAVELCAGKNPFLDDLNLAPDLKDFRSASASLSEESVQKERILDNFDHDEAAFETLVDLFDEVTLLDGIKEKPWPFPPDIERKLIHNREAVRKLFHALASSGSSNFHDQGIRSALVNLPFVDTI